MRGRQGGVRIKELARSQERQRLISVNNSIAKMAQCARKCCAYRRHIPANQARPFRRGICLDLLLGVLEARFGGIPVVGMHQRDRMIDTEDWPRENNRIRESGQPTNNRWKFTSIRNDWSVMLDQARGALPILCHQRVVNRFDRQPLLLEPGAGAAVEGHYRITACTAAEPLAQHLSEEVMIAIPASLGIQRYHEQIGTFEVL